MSASRERKPKDPDEMSENYDETHDEFNDVTRLQNLMAIRGEEQGRKDFEAEQIVESFEKVSKDQENWGSRIYIQLQLRALAEKLKETSESKWRNVVLVSLTRDEGPDYDSAEKACKEYFKSPHLRNSPKTRIIRDIQTLLEQLKETTGVQFEGSTYTDSADEENFGSLKDPVDVSWFKDNGEKEDVDFSEVKMVGEQELETDTVDIKIIGNQIVRDDGKETPIPFKEIYDSPALQRKLVWLLEKSLIKNRQFKNEFEIRFKGDEGKETLEVKLDGKVVSGFTLQTIIIYKEVQDKFMEEFEKKFKPVPTGLKIVGNGIVIDDGENIPISFSRLYASTQLMEKLNDAFEEKIREHKKTDKDYDFICKNLEFEFTLLGRQWEREELVIKWDGNISKMTLENLVQTYPQACKDVFFKALARKFEPDQSDPSQLTTTTQVKDDGD